MYSKWYHRIRLSVHANLPTCSNDITSPEAKRSPLAVSVFHVRASRATACQTAISVKQSNQQRSLLSRSDGWRLTAKIYIFCFLLSSWQSFFPHMDFAVVAALHHLLFLFLSQTQWCTSSLRISDIMHFYVVTKLSVMLARGSLTWRCLLAGLMVYLSDTRLLPSVRGTSHPQSHMILQLAAQCLITEDNGSSDSLLIHYFCHLTSIKHIFFFNEATTIRAH